MKRGTWIVIAVAIVFLGLSGLWMSRIRHRSDSIKLGAILSMTGDAASYGDMMKKGMDVALDEINSAGGINGTPLQIIYEDSQFDPKLADNAFLKLTSVDQVKIITGVTGSKNALAVAPDAIKQKVIIIDALSSSPKLSDFGGQYYFRVMPSDFLAGQFIADKTSQRGQKQAGVFYANDDWGRGILGAARSRFNSAGGQVVSAESIEPGTKDFRSVINKVLASQPNVIWLFAYAPEAGLIVKQLRELNHQISIIGSDNLSAGEFTNVGSSTVEGVEFVLPVEGQGTIYNTFREKYKQRYGEYPSINSIKSYDTVILAAQAIRKAGNDPERISQYLKNERDFVGASGSISFDSHGDITTPAYQVMVYRAGKYEVLEK